MIGLQNQNKILERTIYQNNIQSTIYNILVFHNKVENLNKKNRIFIDEYKKEARYPSWTKMSDGQKPASFVINYSMCNNKIQ